MKEGPEKTNIKKTTGKRKPKINGILGNKKQNIRVTSAELFELGLEISKTWKGAQDGLEFKTNIGTLQFPFLHSDDMEKILDFGKKHKQNIFFIPIGKYIKVRFEPKELNFFKF